MVLLLLTFCLLLLPLWESVIVLCIVVRYFMSILVLQSSWWGRESWLLCLICLPGVSWWLSGSSSRCHGVVCSLWLWYFLITLIIFEHVVRDLCCVVIIVITIIIIIIIIIIKSNIKLVINDLFLLFSLSVCSLAMARTTFCD